MHPSYMAQILHIKGYFGPFEGYVLCLGSVGAHLEGFLLPWAEVATRALQSL